MDGGAGRRPAGSRRAASILPEPRQPAARRCGRLPPRDPLDATIPAVSPPRRILDDDAQPAPSDCLARPCAPRCLHRWLALGTCRTGPAGPLPGRRATPAPATTPKATAPEPIPAGDIPAVADADERFAQDVIARARQKDLGRKLGQQLDTMTTGIVTLSKTFENVDLKSLPAIRLESLQKHWRFYDRELHGLAQRPGPRVRAFQRRRRAAGAAARRVGRDPRRARRAVASPRR